MITYRDSLRDTTDSVHRSDEVYKDTILKIQKASVAGKYSTWVKLLVVGVDMKIQGSKLTVDLFATLLKRQGLTVEVPDESRFTPGLGFYHYDIKILWD